MHIPFVNVSIFGSCGSHFVFLFRILIPIFDDFSVISGGGAMATLLGIILTLGTKGQKLIKNRFIKRILHWEAKWILNIEHWEKPQKLIKNGLIKRIFHWEGTRIWTCSASLKPPMVKHCLPGHPFCRLGHTGLLVSRPATYVQSFILMPIP